MGVIFLFLHLGLFFLLFLFSNLLIVFTHPLTLFLLVAGFVVGGLGLINIGRISYSPLPQPTNSNLLSERGIYRYIRHPMYTGLMLIALSFLLSRFTLFTFVLFLLFILANEFKANMEEKLMTHKHPEYAKYKRRVSKFIPYIF